MAGFSSLHESVKNQTKSFYITVDNKPDIPQMNQKAFDSLSPE